MPSHLASLARAPFDFRLIAEVHGQRTRRTIGFFFVLVLLSAAVSTALVTLAVRDGVRRLLPEVDKIPTITIRNGEVSADVPQPWLKSLGRDDQSGKEIVVIIDTTGKLDGFTDGQMGLFLKKTVLVVKSGDDQLRSLPLRSVRDIVIGPQLLRRWLERARWLVPLVFAGLALIWYSVAKLLQALLLVLVALLATTGRTRPLRFGALFTVAVYGMTPAVLLDCALKPTPAGGLWAFLLYVSLMVIWTVLGARRIPDPPVPPPIRLV